MCIHVPLTETCQPNIMQDICVEHPSDGGDKPVSPNSTPPSLVATKCVVALGPRGP